MLFVRQVYNLIFFRCDLMYSLLANVDGEPLGYIAEEASSVFSRQILRTHRPFRAVVMDASGTPILSVRRKMKSKTLIGFDNDCSKGRCAVPLRG
jgi:hypothetical protein